MKKVFMKDANKIANKLGVNLDIVPLKEWKYGMQVEMEHGTWKQITNVTNDDLLLTGKIALAHLLEFPDYYTRLEKMENQAKKYWKGKRKPKIMKDIKKRNSKK